MKIRLAVVLCVASVVFSGCTKENSGTSVESAIPESFEDEVNEDLIVENEVQIEEEKNFPDEAAYIGEYLDYDVSEPNLEIAKGVDGKYIVQIGIFRLTTLDDGVGELTPEGMIFTATDAAGNPISGIITVEDEIARVTFTDSTWDLLENGSVYMYSKSSDVPNIWGE